MEKIREYIRKLTICAALLPPPGEDAVKISNDLALKLCDVVEAGTELRMYGDSYEEEFDNAETALTKFMEEVK